MAAAGIDTPTDLARRMKVNRQTVHTWVRGKRAKLTPEMLFKLADALNVNAKWLALGPPNMPSKPKHLAPDDNELIEIARALDDATRDQWLSSGRTMVRLTARASTANPFPARHK